MGLFTPRVEWGYAGKVQGHDRNGYYVNGRMVGYVEVIGTGGKAFYQDRYLGYFARWQGAQARVEGEHTAQKH